ncbi:hypothetical protein GUITHDRAFT_46798, partial [Guillardia theta CCMP2712]
VGVRSFRFSNVMDAQVGQEDVYSNFARNAVISSLNGFNSCVLAYGQTGSGKTFSLFGPPQWMDELEGTSSKLGIVVRSMWELLDAREKMAREKLSALAISVQYVQVYQEVVTDLVDGKKVNLRTSSSGFELHGAAETTVASRRDLLEVFRRGEENKRYRATAMNERSSRAHTILVVNLQQNRSKDSAGVDRTEQLIIRSQLVLADLAGCEHISKSKVEGSAKREAASINSGLLVLKKCIKALNEERSHVPFLESRLTMLLKGALGGSSRTYVLVTGTLEDSHGDETIEALRFGEHCQNITN